MTTSQEVADVLERAADLIEPPKAWQQRSFGASGCYCLYGAIFTVARNGGPSGNREQERVGQDAFDVVKSQLGGFNPILWNDVPGRRQSEVVKLLREAAKKAREASQ